MGSDDLRLSLATIRAVAQQTASLSVSDQGSILCLEALPRSPGASPRSPRNLGASPAFSLCGVPSERTRDLISSRSAPDIGSTQDRLDSRQTKSTGHLGIIEEVPGALLPNPVQMAVQQAVELAAAVTMPWDVQNSPRRPDFYHDDDAASSEGGSQETDSKSCVPKGKSKTPARFQETLNRLHNIAEQYQHNRQQRQLQKAQDEAEALSQAKPKINKRSAQLASNIEPLAVRTEKKQALREKKLENERLKKVEQEMEEIKGSPRINQKSQEICRNRSPRKKFSQYQWDKERRQRLEVEKEQRKEEELRDCTFKPQLCSMSEKLLKQSSDSGDVHERLHRQAGNCKRRNRHDEASFRSVKGSNPLDAELSQGPPQAVSFEGFMGLESPSAASATCTPHSSTCSEEREPVVPQASPRQLLIAAQSSPNPVTKELPALQEEQQHQEETPLQEEQQHQEETPRRRATLPWEDEQDALNRTVRYLSKRRDSHWEEVEFPWMRRHNVMKQYEEELGKKKRHQIGGFVARQISAHRMM